MNVIDDHLDPGIRSGHRTLLSTLRELTAEAAPPAVAPIDRATLAATVAFLRQGLQPFARWEEERLGRDHLKEEAEFEHAFLYAEIDRLAALLARSPDEAADHEIRRHLHRIEAVLEMHVLKAEDRDAAPTAPAPAPPSGPRPMSSAEIEAFLGGRTWGVLAVVAGDRPYAVPVSYGLDGGMIYLATGPGLKLEALRACPEVCITVLDVTNGSRYRSVVIRGRAEVVSDVRGRLHGLNALRRQRNEPFSARDVARAASSTLFRVLPDEVSGRLAGSTANR